MRKIMMSGLFVFTMFITGCLSAKLPPDATCVTGTNCASGNCTGGFCVGKDNGATCVIPAECASRQCDGTSHTCVPTTCNPVCSGEDVCADGVNCVPFAGRLNGASCFGFDEFCLSLKCDERTKTCVPRSNGAYCIQNENCDTANGSTCVASACQKDITCSANPCPVGKVCTTGTCNSVLLGLKDACQADAQCGSGFCDPVMGHTCQVRPGSCSPTYPPASTVTCGTQVLPNNGCGTTPSGTGTYCAAGTCNGSTCITTCTPTYPPASSVTCGTPVLPNNSCGSTPNGTGTYCATGSCNGTSCVAALNGAALYGTYCASCHSPLANSTKKNRSASQIQSAITNNAGGMATSSMLALSSAQVQAIADALAPAVVIDFAVSAPASLSVTIPVTGSSTASTSVTVTTADVTTKSVALSVAGAPAGVTASYNPASVTVSSSSASSTLVLTVQSTTIAGTYPITVSGSWNTSYRYATMNLVVSTASGNGKANGAVCAASTECASNNCGPVWSATKTCNGVVDIDQTATNAYDCHSGVFIQGTNKCAPDQFRMCAGLVGLGIQAWTDVGSGGTYLAGADKCWTSSPALNHRSATENGDLSGSCRQLTFWTQAGTTCNWAAPSYMAVWNKGRVY